MHDDQAAGWIKLDSNSLCMHAVKTIAIPIY